MVVQRTSQTRMWRKLITAVNDGKHKQLYGQQHHTTAKPPLKHMQTGSKLSTNEDILRRLFFVMHSEKKTVKDSSAVLKNKLLGIWKCAWIPTHKDYHIKPKIEKVYGNWRASQKWRLRIAVLTNELLGIWKYARIPTQKDYHVKSNIDKSYRNWHAFQKKGKSRMSQPQIKKEKSFQDQLTDLFNTAHLNTLKIIQIDEDKKFLLA
ncbi:Uncharacterized protein FWK35_00018369 [Aphis craccivora]|uniref:Uncharacterized protein n=1 Tax=Aphis craccivora TaxID=307492 RepID=A0A6G0YEP8_APHCR|nr:Uncharacterized protein FWK35_00018369 [Aphis craccivora]